MKPNDNVGPETTALLQAIVTWLGAIRDLRPAYRDVLAVSVARVAFDAHERVLLLSLVDSQGQSTPFLAVDANPASQETFGDVGQPVGIEGVYGAAGRPN